MSRVENFAAPEVKTSNAFSALLGKANVFPMQNSESANPNSLEFHVPPILDEKAPRVSGRAPLQWSPRPPLLMPKRRFLTKWTLRLSWKKTKPKPSRDPIQTPLLHRLPLVGTIVAGTLDVIEANDRDFLSVSISEETRAMNFSSIVAMSGLTLAISKLMMVISSARDSSLWVGGDEVAVGESFEGS